MDQRVIIEKALGKLILLRVKSTGNLDICLKEQLKEDEAGNFLISDTLLFRDEKAREQTILEAPLPDWAVITD